MPPVPNTLAKDLDAAQAQVEVLQASLSKTAVVTRNMRSQIADLEAQVADLTAQLVPVPPSEESGL